jgi:hypothetical protein
VRAPQVSQPRSVPVPGEPGHASGNACDLAVWSPGKSRFPVGLVSPGCSRTRKPRNQNTLLSFWGAWRKVSPASPSHRHSRPLPAACLPTQSSGDRRSNHQSETLCACKGGDERARPGTITATNNYGDRIPIPRTPPPRRKILSLPLQTGANQPKVPIRKKLQLR